ncbi:MAG: YidB family protein [Burkholderiales bacterium]
MGLLDSMIGGLAGGMGGQGRGGTQGALLNAVIAMLANRQGQGGAGGGLGDLIGKFTQGGLGDVIGSWVGHGQNAPISGGQLSDVLGSDMISDLAAQLGLSHEEAAGQLSQVLPQVVDRLTPQGHAPAGGLGGMDDLLAQLSQMTQGR